MDMKLSCSILSAEEMEMESQKEMGEQVCKQFFEVFPAGSVECRKGDHAIYIDFKNVRSIYATKRRIEFKVMYVGVELRSDKITVSFEEGDTGFSIPIRGYILSVFSDGVELDIW